MAVTIATAANYWISPTALSITLNALGEANRIQASVASGAAIVCYIRGVKPASAGSEYAKNGDGLEYDNGHNYRRWPLAIMPTYFNTNDEIYLYVAIPRSIAVGTDALVVFPNRKLDIYGYEVVTQIVRDDDGHMLTPDGEITDDPDKAAREDVQGTQYGTDDYFYIWLQGIITSSGTGYTPREWKENHYPQTGTLATDEALDPTESNWYRWNSIDQTVTFLKEIIMDSASWFKNLNINGKTINGVAQKGVTPETSTDTIVTPDYLDGFGNQKYLSKVHDDTAAGLIAFLQGLKLGDLESRYGITGDGIATLLDIIFDGYLKSDGAREGFQDGKGIWMDAKKGLIQTDGLEVRGFMRVMELIINRLQLMESDYSFTEGDTITHIDYEDSGQTLVLTMDKDHDTDFTPFYEGDIIYAKINDLLPKGVVPEGHTPTKNGSYYTSWMWVESVDLEKNQLRVHLYPGLKQNGDPYVPGSANFSPHGTMLRDRDVSTEMAEEFNTVGIIDPDDPTKAEGYGCRIAVTRHGNIANSSDEHIRQSQLGRQQSWVLSTTDQRITYYWRVDEPIVGDDNFALVLGILPRLGCLPYGNDGQPAWNVDMPSLFVNSVFYAHSHKINWPATIVKQDRGTWTTTPTARYEGPSGTRTPDGTLDAATAMSLGWIGSEPLTFTGGDIISEPYHFEHLTRCRWIALRLNSANDGYSDAKLYELATTVWTEENDLETSRVWWYGILWECLVDRTSQQPAWDSTDWQPIGGDMVYYCEITSSAGTTFRNGNVDTILTMEVRFGQVDITDSMLQKPGAVVEWSRKTGWDAVNHCFVQTSEDREWQSTQADSPKSIVLTRSDMGSGWMIDYRQAMICCSVYVPEGDGGEVTEYPAQFIQKV